MRVIAVPVKPLEEAKRRLSRILSPAERAVLSLAMLEDVLDATLAMPGWDTDPACLASARNRASTSGCWAYSVRSSLTATGRPSTRSVARQISPTPPRATGPSRR